MKLFLIGPDGGILKKEGGNDVEKRGKLGGCEFCWEWMIDDSDVLVCGSEVPWGGNVDGKESSLGGPAHGWLDWLVGGNKADWEFCCFFLFVCFRSFPDIFFIF